MHKINNDELKRTYVLESLVVTYVQCKAKTDEL